MLLWYTRQWHCVALPLLGLLWWWQNLTEDYLSLLKQCNFFCSGVSKPRVHLDDPRDHEPWRGQRGSHTGAQWCSVWTESAVLCQKEFASWIVLLGSFAIVTVQQWRYELSFQYALSFYFKARFCQWFHGTVQILFESHEILCWHFM